MSGIESNFQEFRSFIRILIPIFFEKKAFLLFIKVSFYATSTLCNKGNQLSKQLRSIILTCVREGQHGHEKKE